MVLALRLRQLNRTGQREARPTRRRARAKRREERATTKAARHSQPTNLQQLHSARRNRPWAALLHHRRTSLSQSPILACLSVQSSSNSTVTSSGNLKVLVHSVARPNSRDPTSLPRFENVSTTRTVPRRTEPWATSTTRDGTDWRSRSRRRGNGGKSRRGWAACWPTTPWGSTTFATRRIGSGWATRRTCADARIQSSRGTTLRRRPF
mmetsp:Transcript_14168/g.30826  ORF Transcript_14168/g.30826 Transcript_14168/m.30826 type:complete len:208 (+) Transcript_14168:160-783(+)